MKKMSCCRDGKLARHIELFLAIFGPLRVCQLTIEFFCKEKAIAASVLQQTLKSLNSAADKPLCLYSKKWMQPESEDYFGSFKIIVVSKKNGNPVEIWKKQCEALLQENDQIKAFFVNILPPDGKRWATEIVLHDTAEEKKDAFQCLPPMTTNIEKRLEYHSPTGRAFLLEKMVGWRREAHGNLAGCDNGN